MSILSVGIYNAEKHQKSNEQMREWARIIDEKDPRKIKCGTCEGCGVCKVSNIRELEKLFKSSDKSCLGMEFAAAAKKASIGKPQFYE